jgi:hypothetical protein
MKTMNYLFIAAAILLCSCKGSSYLKQRYTHFGHGTAQSVAHQPASAIVDHAQAKALPVQEVQEASVEKTTIMITGPESNAQEMTLVASVENKLQSSPAKNFSRLLSLPVSKAKAEFQKKREQASEVQSHRGLISGLLGLILYIIFCAVVIAAIIILVLLIV